MTPRATLSEPYGVTLCAERRGLGDMDVVGQELARRVAGMPPAALATLAHAP